MTQRTYYQRYEYAVAQLVQDGYTRRDNRQPGEWPWVDRTGLVDAVVRNDSDQGYWLDYRA